MSQAHLALLGKAMRMFAAALLERDVWWTGHQCHYCALPAHRAADGTVVCRHRPTCVVLKAQAVVSSQEAMEKVQKE